jgi:hypothetical protein
VNVTAKLSATGKREQRYFFTKEKTKNFKIAKE